MTENKVGMQLPDSERPISELSGVALDNEIARLGDVIEHLDPDAVEAQAEAHRRRTEGLLLRDGPNSIPQAAAERILGKPNVVPFDSLRNIKNLQNGTYISHDYQNGRDVNRKANGKK